MKRLTIMLATLILIFTAVTAQAEGVNGSIYARYHFNSTYGTLPVDGWLVGLHVEKAFYQGKFIPFVDTQVTTNENQPRGTYDGHFAPYKGDFGGGFRSNWGNWVFTVKMSSMHTFDMYSHVWEYNYVEMKYSW